MNAGIDFILRRRSIRKYTSQPVEPEKLEQLLKAAMAAPSAMNCKPWEFILVTDPGELAEFRKRLPFGNRNAPAAIVVCGNPFRSINPAARLFWVQDCSAATENILLAASGLGLGAVWIGIYPVRAFIRVVRQVVSLPPNIRPLCLVYVGYAQEQKPPRSQYDPSRISSQKYGQGRKPPAGTE
jgi:nitroreductase